MASKDFQCYAYQLISDKSVTLIHYVGDENVAVDFPHGNRNTINKSMFGLVHHILAHVSRWSASNVYKKYFV